VERLSAFSSVVNLISSLRPFTPRAFNSLAWHSVMLEPLSRRAKVFTDFPVSLLLILTGKSGNATLSPLEW
jgi:hypothetical protein